MKPDFEATKRKAEAGDAEALYNLGASCERGRGVPQSDEEAACWYRRAAVRCDRSAAGPSPPPGATPGRGSDWRRRRIDAGRD